MHLVNSIRDVGTFWKLGGGAKILTFKVSRSPEITISQSKILWVRKSKPGLLSWEQERIETVIFRVYFSNIEFTRCISLEYVVFKNITFPWMTKQTTFLSIRVNTSWFTSKYHFLVSCFVEGMKVSRSFFFYFKIQQVHSGVSNDM